MHADDRYGVILGDIDRPPPAALLVLPDASDAVAGVEAAERVDSMHSAVIVSSAAAR